MEIYKVSVQVVCQEVEPLGTNKHTYLVHTPPWHLVMVARGGGLDFDSAHKALGETAMQTSQVLFERASQSCQGLFELCLVSRSAAQDERGGTSTWVALYPHPHACSARVTLSPSRVFLRLKPTFPGLSVEDS
jgi:hypothetical protein